MKRFLLVFALALLFTSGPVGPAFAQTIDLDQVSHDVLATDVDDLITGLQRPISDSILPTGFNAPKDGLAAGQDFVDAFSQGLQDINGIEASISHGVDLDRQVIDYAMGTGILTAIVFDMEITNRDFGAFAESMRNSFNASSDMEGDVSEVTIAGVSAAHVSTQSAEDGVYLDIEIFAVPVGNVILIGTALIGDTVEPDPSVLAPFAKDLTLAGVGWIAKAADSSEAPDKEDPAKDKFGVSPWTHRPSRFER